MTLNLSIISCNYRMKNRSCYLNSQNLHVHVYIEKTLYTRLIFFYYIRLRTDGPVSPGMLKIDLVNNNLPSSGDFGSFSASLRARRTALFEAS